MISSDDSVYAAAKMIEKGENGNDATCRCDVRRLGVWTKKRLRKMEAEKQR